MKKYFKIFVIILVASIVLPQVALAAWWNPLSWGIFNRFFSKIIPALQKNVANKPAKILEISVVKPNIVVTGQNLSKVQIYFVPTGTEIDLEKIEGQEAKKISEVSGKQMWVYKYSTDLLITNIFAKGYDLKGNFVGKIDLSIVGASALAEALYCRGEGQDYFAGDMCCSGLERQPTTESGTVGKCIKTEVKLDLNIFLPGQYLLSTLTSGEWGTFNTDHTVSLAWGLDYVGPNDTRKSSEIGHWSLDGNVLTITNPDETLHAEYDFSKMAKLNIDGKTIFAEQNSIDEKGIHSGIFIGDKKTIEKMTGIVIK